MKPLFHQIISDSKGKGSATRVTLFALVVLLITLAVGVFFFNAHFNEAIWSDIFFAVLIFGGYNKAELFTKNKKDQTADK